MSLHEIASIGVKMKGNKRQREKESDKTKTKPPHSISSGASVSTKVLNVSKKSQVIQKKPEKSALQSKLVLGKNENGTKSLTVSKVNASVSGNKTHETRSVKSNVTAPKPTSQVELKVSAKSPVQSLNTDLFEFHLKLFTEKC